MDKPDLSPQSPVEFMPRGKALIVIALIAFGLTGCSRNKVRLVSAVYGSGTSFADVTARAEDLMQKPSGFDANPGWLKVDPSPGWNKVLVITYDVNGQRHVFATGENGRVNSKLLLDAAR
jgi:hypothetical protein